MKNKRFLKVLSCGALASLLVTPLVLNGVADGDKVEEEVADIDLQSEKVVRNSKTYSDETGYGYSLGESGLKRRFGKMFMYKADGSRTNYVDVDSVTAVPSFEDKSMFDSHNLFVNYNITGSYGGMFFLDNLDSTKTYKLYFHTTDSDDFNDYWYKGYNLSYDEYEYMCAIHDGWGLSQWNSWFNAQSCFEGQYVIEDGGEFCDSYVLLSGSSSYCIRFSPEILTGLDFDISIQMGLNIVNVGSVDTKEPVVTASTYSTSLPVGTSTRITAEYLLNQKIFSVIDDTDGDITDNLVIESDNVNYSKIGTYDVVCSWTDNAGNKSSVTLKVVVGDFVKPSYTITSSTINVECPNVITNETLLANVKFTDNYDSADEITKTIVKNDYAQKTKCGTYPVTIRGIDTSGNYTEATFNVVVRDTIAPVINGLQGTIYGGSDINLDVVENGSGCTATYTLDDTAKQYASDKKITLSGLSHGQHTLKVQDVSGNSNTYTFYVDKKGPEVSGVVNGGRYNSSLSITITDDLSILSEYSKNNSVVSWLSENVKTKTITLDKNSLVQGNNTLVFKDKLGNTTTINFVYDDVAPIITPNVSGDGSIKSGQYVSAEQVKAQFTANDNVDGNISIVVVSSNIVDKVGVYEVVLRATDKTGNSTELSVTVERLDITAPVIFINSSDDITIMRVASGTELTYENLLKIFMFLYQDDIDSQNYDVEVLSDGYVASGTEKQSIRYVVTDKRTGEAKTMSLDYESYEISVTPDDKKDDVIPDDNDKEETKSWWSKMWSWIGNKLKQVWNWVTGLFGSNKKDDVTTTDNIDMTSIEDGRLVKDGVETEEVESEYIVW